MAIRRSSSRSGSFISQCDEAAQQVGVRSAAFKAAGPEPSVVRRAAGPRGPCRCGRARAAGWPSAPSISVRPRSVRTSAWRNQRPHVGSRSSSMCWRRRGPASLDGGTRRSVILALNGSSSTRPVGEAGQDRRQRRAIEARLRRRSRRRPRPAPRRRRSPRSGRCCRSRRAAGYRDARSGQR